MKFLLVHGAFQGGWCWIRVRQILQQAGHEVFTPSLTGLGERKHLLSPEVGLEIHIQEIVNLLEFEDLREVVLAGHSDNTASDAITFMHFRRRSKFAGRNGLLILVAAFRR
jgi:hypothetical protein